MKVSWSLLSLNEKVKLLFRQKVFDITYKVVTVTIKVVAILYLHKRDVFESFLTNIFI